MLKNKIWMLWAVCVPLSCFAQTTNVYHFERTFESADYQAGTPTQYKVITGLDEQEGIVWSAPEVTFISNETYGTEYDALALGYESPMAAWTSALATYSSYYSNYPGLTFNDAGWIKGTRESYGSWGAFIWYLKNTIGFYSSTSTTYVTSDGRTSEIACVLVGTIGDYEPMAHVTDVSPSFDTNYIGESVATNVVYRPDFNVYYKLVEEYHASINDDDSDDDDIPDYADGFDWNGTTGDDDDISTNDYLLHWNLFLSLYATNPQEALVKIDYNASDPTTVTCDGTNYFATNGYFRLWNTNAYWGTRNPNSITSASPGNYVSPGTYRATDLGYSTNQRQTKLFVEPINLCTSQYLTVKLDPDGTNGTKDFVTMDKMKASAYSVELSCDVATNSPKRFEFNDRYLEDTCFFDDGAVYSTSTTLAAEQEIMDDALTILRKDVVDSDGLLQPFTITMQVQPEVENVQWELVSSPESGTLSNANECVAYFVNPTNGGRYVFELTVNDRKTQIQFWLPVAGPDISYYWENEIERLKDWGDTYRSNLNERSGGIILQSLNPVLFESMAQLHRVLDIRRFGFHLDWQVPSGSDGDALYAGDTPCGFGEIVLTNSSAGDRERFTMYGKVIDFAKRSNMGFAFVAKEMGFPDYLIYTGPDLVNFVQTWSRGSTQVGTLDSSAATESYAAGIDLADDISLSAVIANRGLKMLHPGMRAEREWPSYESTTASLELETNTWAIMEELIQ